MNELNYLNIIKSNFVLQKIISYLKENILLECIRYNKTLQNKINKKINDYKNYSK